MVRVNKISVIIDIIKDKLEMSVTGDLCHMWNILTRFFFPPFKAI